MLARIEKIQPNSLVLINPTSKFMTTRKLCSQTQTAIIYTHTAIKHQEKSQNKKPICRKYKYYHICDHIYSYSDN